MHIYLREGPIVLLWCHVAEHLKIILECWTGHNRYITLIALHYHLYESADVAWEYTQGLHAAKHILDGVAAELFHSAQESLLHSGIKDLTSVDGNKGAHVRINLGNYERVYIKKLRHTLHWQV